MESIIKREQVKEILKSAGSTIFGCSFIKRSTGEVRDINCRMGVVKHLRGGKPAYSFAEKNLLPVYDVVNKGYRVIALEGVLEIRLGGNIYLVRQK